MIPLAVHSHYSLMRGTAAIPELCGTAARAGFRQLALTDSDNLYGLWPFLASCREHDLRPIVGAEVTDPDAGDRAFCLVEDQAGYTSLCRLLTARHCDPEFSLSAAVFKNHAGLSILTDSSSLLRLWRQEGLPVTAALIGRPDLHSHRIHRLAEQLGIPCVAVPDAYFPAPDDHRHHLLLRAIDTNTTLSRLKPTDCAAPWQWLPSAREFSKRFSIWPEAVRNSFQVAERCRFTGPEFGLTLPPYHNRSKEEADRELRHKALAGALERYGDKLPEAVTSRLEHELRIIGDMNFSSYFLVVHDIVRPNPRICGRGSGAASLVAYCLRITNVCPVKHNLYFERFLNPGRTDAPDIDIDFAWDERDAMFAGLLAGHGNHAAMVCNHIFFKPRSAIREVAKVFGLPGGEIGRISKRLPWFYPTGESESLLERVRSLPELRGVDFDQPWPEIFHLAQRLIKSPRCLSVHPGGIIITPRPLSDYVPIQKAPKGVPIIQWEKDGAEEAGLVKIDLLGNRSLGVIRDAVRQVKDNGLLFDEERWEPEDDPDTRQTVADGRTMGCFYIESPAMRLLQKKAGVGDFEHLVIHSSIIRPAANEFIREYVRRLHGGDWQPLHPILDGVLDETFGIMVYQEDVSRVAVQFGFSHADADRLRKIMSKKDKRKKLADYRKQFFDNAERMGVDTEITERIWAMMMSFDGYSFCKPHSASYARVSFQAAYLKTHYPAEFMAAVISNQGGYYSTFAYVSEARRLGLTILGPDVTRSGVAWQGRDRSLRVGLMTVRNLSDRTMEAIVRQRDKLPFSSFRDFLNRIRPEDEEAGAMIHAGALDCLLHPSEEGAERNVAVNRAHLRYQLALWRKQIHTGYGSFMLFPETNRLPDLPPEDPMERLRNEFRVLGFLCDRHPVTLFDGIRKQLGTMAAADLSNHVHRRVLFLGWLVTGKTVSAKTGEPMEFLTLEDETGQVECTFFPETYARHCHLLHRRGPLLLEGIVEEDFGAATLTVTHAEEIGKAGEPGNRRDHRKEKRSADLQRGGNDTPHSRIVPGTNQAA